MSKLPDPGIRTQLPAILESPALYRDAASLPAYEVKFLLTEAQAVEVRKRLQPRLTLDPHADPALGDAYMVTSVYFDTPAFDVYAKTKGYRRSKFRVRRYGDGDHTFVERKMKSQQRVRKRRTTAALDELEALNGEPKADSPCLWFTEQLRNRNLKPVCRVTYRRIALIGACHEGPIRATFDRAARAVPTNNPLPVIVQEGTPLLQDEVIAEFKFLGSMPAVFKTAVEEMQLAPQSVSKYKRSVERTGLVVPGAAANV